MHVIAHVIVHVHVIAHVIVASSLASVVWMDPNLRPNSFFFKKGKFVKRCCAQLKIWSYMIVIKVRSSTAAYGCRKVRACASAWRTVAGLQPRARKR
jgi:hypothetical protein